MVELLARRSLLGGKADDGYIGDGLVFRLDGINKGTDDPTKWVDLVGGMVFTEAGNTAVHDTDSIYLTSAQRMVGDSMPDWPYTTHTIEAAMSPVGGWAPIFLMRHGNVAIYKNPDWQIIGGNKGAYKAGTNQREKAIGFAYDRIMLDGELKEAMPNVWNGWNNSLPVINSGSTRQQYYSRDLRLYAFRVYDRLLTIDEMLHNQRVDNERYGLGLTI